MSIQHRSGSGVLPMLFYPRAAENPPLRGGRSRCRVKFKSASFTAASGSIGGMTFSHNRGGMYVRARATPTNPNSPEQSEVRTLMGMLSNLWVSTLTIVQRAGWIIYGENVPIVNRLGDDIFLTGLNHYIRSNVPRLQAGLTRVDSAPASFTIGSFTNPTFVGTAATDLVATSFTVGDEWVNEDDAAMLIFLSRPQNPSIFFFKGPYRLAGSILGDATTPPTSPASITAPFLFSAGQKVFVRTAVTRADGRYSYSERKSFLGV